MQDIEPPEVPTGFVDSADNLHNDNNTAKRDGFFKKLFSKKYGNTDTKISDTENISSMDTPIISGAVPELPPLPTLNDEQFQIPETGTKKVGKAKGRHLGKKYDSFNESENFDWIQPITTQESLIIDNTKNIVANKDRGKLKKGAKHSRIKFDGAKNFDWTRQINDQEILIHDSSRDNPDINILLEKAKDHIDTQSALLKDNQLLTTHENTAIDIPKSDIDTANAANDYALSDASIPSMPVIDPVEQRSFQQINMNHAKIRKTLERLLKDPKANGPKIKELLKAYDEQIEKRLEQKEMVLSSKKHKLESFHKLLKGKESGIRKLHAEFHKLNTVLKERESKIDETIKNNVEKQLARRTPNERKVLKKELSKTMKLNTELKSKIATVERDMKAFDKKKQDVFEKERKKLSELQAIYDKKLSELEHDRGAFEEHRRNSIVLLNRGDVIAKELDDIKRIRTYVESSKNVMHKELLQDKELRAAIDRAEAALRHKREELDHMVFSKYIVESLKNIRPQTINMDEDVRIETNPIYRKILGCRNMLDNGDIIGAKRQYNDIKKSFEYSKMPTHEKGLFYNMIRELYSDIQLRSLDATYQDI